MAKRKAPPAATPDQRFEALRALPQEELAALLAEVAATHPEVEERLARHALSGDPARLAAEFRKRLQSWKRSGHFFERGAAAEFGRELEAWLDETERELLPLDPARAHALADAFVRSDGCFFEQADDSDGAIGDAIRAGCRLWLRAAKAQSNKNAAEWIERVFTLVNADEYGAREALLRHSDLLAWLDGDWGYREEDRERLLAEAYAALGDTTRLRAVRQALFDRTGTASDFEAWQQSLEPADRAHAAEVARERANILDDPITGVGLLLALNDDAAAEALLLARHATVRGEAYGGLAPLAQALEDKGRVLGAIVCCRALLVAILARAYARAYGHAAEYLHTLRRLDGQVHDYQSLPTHQAFESSIRSMHGRKVGFWKRVGSR
jgi:hypothetical protein